MSNIEEWNWTYLQLYVIDFLSYQLRYARSCVMWSVYCYIWSRQHRCWQTSWSIDFCCNLDNDVHPNHTEKYDGNDDDTEYNYCAIRFVWMVQPLMSCTNASVAVASGSITRAMAGMAKWTVYRRGHDRLRCRRYQPSLLVGISLLVMVTSIGIGGEDRGDAMDE